MKARRLSLIALASALVVGIGAALLWYQAQLRPMPSGKTRYIRWERPARIRTVLNDLAKRRIVRSADAARLYGWLNRKPALVQTGTYELTPGMTLDQVFAELQKPVRQMVRIPETNWARRTATLLEADLVCKADDYMALIGKPAEFQEYVDFPLPSDTLEGYLYPDTYDLPPLYGAKATIIRQLRTFQDKVWEPYHQPANLHELVIKASLVQLEAGRDDERPMIAGVIDNRLKKGMRLQIDAALLYGIQKWRRLTFADYRNIDSPYNLYRVDGLPPGPICSPSRLSFAAAKNPATHAHLYYVALPNGSSLFAKTYDEHLKNIEKRKAALKAEAGS